jgi:hypothetical protein
LASGQRYAFAGNRAESLLLERNSVRADAKALQGVEPFGVGGGLRTGVEGFIDRFDDYAGDGCSLGVAHEAGDSCFGRLRKDR